MGKSDYTQDSTQDSTQDLHLKILSARRPHIAKPLRGIRTDPKWWRCTVRLPRCC